MQNSRIRILDILGVLGVLGVLGLGRQLSTFGRIMGYYGGKVR